MLSDAEKQRIQAEEIYRAEVQADLAKAKKPKAFSKHVWPFLNTSLGIWFLSTIALGVVARSYAARQSSQEVTKRIERIDREIEGRIDRVLAAPRCS